MNRTGIEWTDRSVNPFRARRKDNGKVGWHCVKTSSGCANCYSEVLDGRFGTRLPYTQRSSALVDLYLDPRMLAAILRLKTPQKIFPCDMTDLFMEGYNPEDIATLFATFAVAHWHTFQVLTKRTDRMAETLCDPDFPALVGRMIDERIRPLIDGKIKGDWGRVSPTAHDLRHGRGWPLPNVWTGFSAEDQANFDARAAAVAPLMRAGWLVWVSAEPLLGPILMQGWDGGLRRNWLAGPGEPGIRWVVVGGESGPDARPMHPGWARSIRDQCQATRTAFHFKQWGSWLPVSKPADADEVVWAGNTYFPRGRWLDLDGGDRHRSWDTVMVDRVGKKAAGRLLDGRTWDEFPNAEAPAHV